MLANVVQELQKHLHSQSKESVLRSLGITTDTDFDEFHYALEGSICISYAIKSTKLFFNGDVVMKAYLKPDAKYHTPPQDSKKPIAFYHGRVPVNSTVIKSAEELVEKLLNLEIEPSSSSSSLVKLVGKGGYNIDFAHSFVGPWITISKEGKLKGIQPEIKELRKIFGKPSETQNVYKL